MRESNLKITLGAMKASRFGLPCFEISLRSFVKAWGKPQPEAIFERIMSEVPIEEQHKQILFNNITDECAEEYSCYEFVKENFPEYYDPFRQDVWILGLVDIIYKYPDIVNFIGKSRFAKRYLEARRPNYILEKHQID